MQQLDLPPYKFKLKKEGEKEFIFDDIRRKFVALTPEEWVRQHFLKYLITEKKYIPSLIIVEGALKVNKMQKRCDAIVYNTCGKAILIIECKATNVLLSQKTFDQIARYNMTYRVNYLIVTNGLTHYCCKINFEKGIYVFMENIPAYDELHH